MKNKTLRTEDIMIIPNQILFIIIIFKPWRPTTDGSTWFSHWRACTFLLEKVSPSGLSTFLAKQIQCHILSTGHHVYMDNYFSSPVICSDLADANTSACGTLHKNCRHTTRHKASQTQEGWLPSYGGGTSLSIHMLDGSQYSNTCHHCSYYSHFQQANQKSPVANRPLDSWSAKHHVQLGCIPTTWGADLTDEAMWYSLNFKEI